VEGQQQAGHALRVLDPAAFDLPHRPIERHPDHFHVVLALALRIAVGDLGEEEMDPFVGEANGEV
jgi:hypothetical protein